LEGFYRHSGPDRIPHPGRRVHITTGEVEEVPLNGIGSPFLSPTGRYIAYRVRQDEGPQPFVVTVEDRTTGQTVTLADPFGGNYPDSPAVLWSSSTDMLAVRSNSVPDNPDDPLSFGLAVYTPDGRLFRRYYNLYGWGWGADGQSLLVSPDSDTRQPCLVSLADNTLRCLDEINDWTADQSVELVWFHLSPDGQQIAFNYWSDSENSRSGLCLLDLDSGDITCPIDNATLGQDVYLRRFTWSPDGRYLALLVDVTSPGSDDLTQAQLATIGIDGQQYRVWGKSLSEAVWRPSLPASPPG
jgi:Tol biopolymer transport system component